MINYLLITKPGIIAGNLLTFFCGFWLASTFFNFTLFFLTFLGLGCVIASACVFNNYIDRDSDQKMERTKNRALVKGHIHNNAALIYGLFLAIVGFYVLIKFTNLLATSLAMIGFIIYVFIYSFGKKKTIYATALGSLAGATPPIVGYTAVSAQMDLQAFLLFALLIVWQMPHFYAITLLHLEDYNKANLPLLPLMKGISRTKWHMVLYILASCIIIILFYLLHYTPYFSFLILFLLNVTWLAIGIMGFKTTNNQRWGKKMFRFSLIVIMATSAFLK